MALHTLQAAEILNMTTEELSAALQGGKTLEQVAEEAGVDFANVQEAIQAAHATDMSERIQQSLDDGTITREHADWLLEGVEKGFLGGPGGFGFGGPHGLKPGTPPATQPIPTSSN